MDFQQEREQVCHMAQRMYRDHLVRGTSGNVSMRLTNGNGFAITPSGMAYELLTPDDIVVLDLAGRVMAGNRRPSSEAPMHRAILSARPDVSGVVHTHSIYATAFACLGEAMPVITTELAGLVGGSVPVAPYAAAGSEELAQAVMQVLGSGSACLMQSHGAVAVSYSLEDAYTVAVGLEEAAQILCLARQMGTPRPIPATESQRMYNLRLTSYGQPKS